MAQYVLLLRDKGEYPRPGMSPEEMQKVFERYRSWADNIQARGKLSGGQKLRSGAGRVMKRNGTGKVSITDGPFTEAKEILGGYFIVEANDYDEVLSLASDCPHLDFGTIEIREIEFMRQ
jgi:hypothetical protein